MSCVALPMAHVFPIQSLRLRQWGFVVWNGADVYVNGGRAENYTEKLLFRTVLFTYNFSSAPNGIMLGIGPTGVIRLGLIAM